MVHKWVLETKREVASQNTGVQLKPTWLCVGSPIAQFLSNARQSPCLLALAHLSRYLSTSFTAGFGDKIFDYDHIMCSHYQAVRESGRYARHFLVDPPQEPGKTDVWPSYASTFIRRPKEAALHTGDDAVPQRESMLGMFGLVPHWATDTNIGRQTYNARTETVAIKPSFRDAWKNAQHCIIPMDAFFEPDWRSGKAISTRISSSNGEPMGIAGLWSSWQSPKGMVHSFTLLTINADGHELMCQFHKPVDEKRMLVILPPDCYDPWLKAAPEQSMDFLRQYPADRLLASAQATASAQRSLLG